MNDKVKKASPVVIGVAIAIAGILVALGIAKPNVQEVEPLDAGAVVRFEAKENAILVKADMEVTFEGQTYSSGEWYLLTGVDRIRDEQPDEPKEDLDEKPIEE
jgi:hypothetical protein